MLTYHLTWRRGYHWFANHWVNWHMEQPALSMVGAVVGDFSHFLLSPSFYHDSVACFWRVLVYYIIVPPVNER